MPQWKNVLLEACEKAYYKGGEVRAVFIRRQDKVIPIIYPPAPAPIHCDEETVIDEED